MQTIRTPIFDIEISYAIKHWALAMEQPKLYKEIGRNIEFKRTELRLSQQALAGKLQPPLTRAAISNMEAGRQGILVHVLLDIARVLMIAPTELLPATEELAKLSNDHFLDQLQDSGVSPKDAALIVMTQKRKAE